jgi:tetratricopeptide (TPR) repeat protein
MTDKIDMLFASWQEDKENLSLTAELINTLFSASDWQRSEALFMQVPLEIRSRSEVYARHIEFLIHHKQLAAAVEEAKSLCNVTNQHPLSMHYWVLSNFLAGNHQVVADLASQTKLIPESKVIVARVVYNRNNFKQAIDLITDTQSAEGLGLLAMAYLDDGQLDKAFDTTEKALKLKANQIDGLQAKACLMVFERNYDRAAGVIEQVLKLKANNGRALAVKGQILFFQKEIQAAVNTLQKALTFLPEHVASLNLLAWCYCIAGQFDVSAMTFEKSLAASPDFVESQGGLAVIAVVQNDIEKATELSQKILSIHPACASANFAQQLIQQGAASNDSEFKQPQQTIDNENKSYGDLIIDIVKQFH